MNDNLIPEELRRFILLHIDSVAELECLILFHKNPGWVADSEAVAGKLYITHEESRSILDHLTSRRFLVTTDEENRFYSFKPATTGLSDAIMQLAETYAQYLVPVTNLIHLKSKSKIQTFADAFWIRKD